MQARVATLFICASLTAWGQKTSVVVLPGPPPLKTPEWLAPFPQARDQSAAATSAEATSSYTALTAAAEVISHYERQMRAAGVTFQIKSDGIGVSIEASAEKASAVVRVREGDGGVRVNVSYALKPDPPAAAPPARALPPLALEWPAWLAPPSGRLVSQRTNPPGRIGTWAEETCPGDLIRQPSQGCLKRTYQSAGRLKDVYAYFESLLAQYGYTTQNASTQPYANLQLGKWVSDVFGSLVMREYPQGQEASYYREINVFLRQPSPTNNTQAEITFTVKNGSAAAAAPAREAPVTSAGRKGDHLSFPPPRGTWTWAIQSVATRAGSGIKYNSYYYEASTDRSVEQPLALPAGAAIVGVFPDDCEFPVRDKSGHSFAFRNEDEAKAKGLGPGTWSVYPLKCGGVDVFLK